MLVGEKILRKTFGCAAALALLLATMSSAAADDMFAAYNQSPLIQIYGMPTLGSARVLAPGETRLSVTFESANNFFQTTTARETLILDGETHRSVLAVRSGAPGFEWGIEVPYVSHSGGFMDSFIEGWHDTFGLPNGGRELAPRNRLNFFYQRDGVERQHITERSGGIGDIRLSFAWPLSTASTHASRNTAIRASLKLATGESRGLHGSGATDLAVWLTTGCKRSTCDRLSWNAAGGVLAVGRGDVLPELQRRLVAFGGAGAAVRVLDSISLRTELLAHTSFYKNSELEPLNANALQLILGGTWHITDKTELDIGVTEDLNVNAAPDVTLLVTLRSNFPR